MFDYDISQAVTEVLIQANSDRQPLLLDTSSIESDYQDTELSIQTMSVKYMYEVYPGFAEGKARAIAHLKSGYH